MLVPGPPYRFSATPVAIGSAPALGSATGFGAARAEKPRLPPRPRARGCAHPRLHVGGRRSVRHVPARDAGRGGRQGRVDETPRSGPARFPRRLRRDQPLAELQRAQPRQAVVPGRPLPTGRSRARPPPRRRVGRRRRRQLPARRHDPVRSRCRDASSRSVPSSSSCPRRRTASTGPEAMAAGLASIFGATGGLCEQTGYADGPPTEIGESTDYRSGSALAVAILAALLHRARTGEGQHVDLASREVVAASSPDALLAEQLGVPWPIRVGNGHRELAPHDVYPAAGEDDWVAVAVGDDTEWAALCAVLDRDEWVSLHPTADARRARVAEIDDAIRAWTQVRSSREAFEALQAAGVPAMAVMTNEMLSTDPHVAARGVFVRHRAPGARPHPRDAPALALLRSRRRRASRSADGSGQRLRARHDPGVVEQRASRARGGAPMSVPGSDVQIGIVAVGDARQVQRARGAARSTRCGSAATSRRATRAPRPWSASCGSPRSPSGSWSARRSCCCRSIRPRSSPSRSPISTAPPNGRVLLGVGIGGEYAQEFRAAPGADRGARPADQRDDPAAAAAVDGRGDHPRRPLLPDGRREDPPGTGAAGRPADHRRRPEGAGHAPSGAARRRLVPLHVLAPPLRRLGRDRPPDRRGCRPRPRRASTGACGCSSTSIPTATSRARKPPARWAAPTTRTSSR